MQQNIAQKCWRIDRQNENSLEKSPRNFERLELSLESSLRKIKHRELLRESANETIGVTKFWRFIATISRWATFRRKAGKSQEIRRNWLALLLHNTVEKPGWLLSLALGIKDFFTLFWQLDTFFAKFSLDNFFWGWGWGRHSENKNCFKWQHPSKVFFIVTYSLLRSPFCLTLQRSVWHVYGTRWCKENALFSTVCYMNNGSSFAICTVESWELGACANLNQNWFPLEFQTVLPPMPSEFRNHSNPP